MVAMLGQQVREALLLDNVWRVSPPTASIKICLPLFIPLKCRAGSRRHRRLRQPPRHRR
jgi:hypothetical protein